MLHWIKKKFIDISSIANRLEDIKIAIKAINTGDYDGEAPADTVDRAEWLRLTVSFYATGYRPRPRVYR